MSTPHRQHDQERTDREIRPTQPRRISFFDELTIAAGTKSDWQHFAHWHYRSRNLGFVRQVRLLEHAGEPIGICIFVSPPTSLQARNRYFGRSGRWDRASLQALNRQLVLLSRVVLHPTYRGAGLAAWFVRQCCLQSGYRWIETLAQMGHIHPLFEQAGFVRVGTSSPPEGRSRAAHSALYGNRVTAQTWRKSRHAAPMYYVFDNRAGRAHCRRAPDVSLGMRDADVPLPRRERDSPGAQRPGQGEGDERAADVERSDGDERADSRSHAHPGGAPSPRFFAGAKNRSLSLKGRGTNTTSSTHRCHGADAPRSTPNTQP